MAGMVIMNLLTGPPLFKAAVVAAGESRAASLPVLQSDMQVRGSSGGRVGKEGGSEDGELRKIGSHGGAQGSGIRIPLPTIPILNA